MGFSKFCLKLSLAVFNTVFFILGCVLLGIGIWAAADKIFISDIIGTYLYSAASYIVIICGAVVFIISFIGCWGAFREIKCMLLVYFICLVVIFVFLVVAAILAVSFRGELEDSMKQAMGDTLRDKYGVDLHNEENDAITRAWDLTQSRFQCCAVENEGWRIYQLSTWFIRQPGDTLDKNAVPKSCCVWLERLNNYNNLKHCQTWTLGPPFVEDGGINDSLFYPGCYNTGKEFVYENAGILLAVGFAFAFAMITGIVLSLLLMIKLSRETSYKE